MKHKKRYFVENPKLERYFSSEFENKVQKMLELFLNLSIENRPYLRAEAAEYICFNRKDKESKFYRVFSLKINQSTIRISFPARKNSQIYLKKLQELIHKSPVQEGSGKNHFQLTENKTTRPRINFHDYDILRNFIKSGFFEKYFRFLDTNCFNREEKHYVSNSILKEVQSDKS